MPKVNWGVSSADVDNFDREKQFKPYDGPIPSNGVYRWTIKVLKHVAGTREKNPQLRIGLELVPRTKAEKRMAGYFVMIFPPITERTQFRYVPFLDAIGVSANEFTRGTITDEEGNIKKIGRWRNTGDVTILAELKDDVDQHGNPRKDIGWMGIDEGDDALEDDDEEVDEDDYDDDEGDDEDDEEAF